MKKILSKRVLSCILALFLIPAFLLTLFAGCADNEETADTYTVTVVNGTIDGTDGDTSGEYEAGASVTVTATIPTGQTFVAWTEDGEVVSTENPYTFEVTGNVTLTATFSGEDTDETYTVTVENGTGGGEYEEGETATVTAATDQGTFSHWEIGGQQVSTDNPYTFTVTGDVTITAVFKDAYTVTVTNGTVNGNASGTFDEGTEVTITASKGSHNFVRWENAAGETLTYTQESFTYEVTANATFVAVLTKTVTVSGGTISGGGTSGEYEAGETVTVVADTAAQGTRFVGWRVGDSTEIVEVARYTYTVGDSDVTITAVFVDTYTVTVNGGTLSGGGTSDTFDEGTEVTVTANEPESGQFFSHWENGAEEKVSTSASYTFEVEDDITLTAVFETLVVAGDALNLNKSTGGNPIGGFGIGGSTFDSSWTTESPAWQEGDPEYADVITYGGDPAVMVVEENGVETAYLYVGHDITTAAVTSTYTMPEWICYSSTDLVNWTCEGIIMDIEDIPWARGQATGSVEQSAWASQVIEYQGHYWFFFCSWSETAAGYVTAGENGNMCIGVAVSDDPTGPFKCYSEPLVYSSWTNVTDNGTDLKDAGWNDIDPTAWVTSEDEFYVAWGNSNSFMCQVEIVETTDSYYAVQNGTLEKDTSISYALEIVDQSESTDDNLVTIDRSTEEPAFYRYGYSNIEQIADIMQIDLWTRNTTNNTFTEAPYLYARDTNEDGAEDRYYMIYAAGWREALAYSYIDVDSPDGIWEDVWTYGNRLMDPTATSNTNHPAVFDFTINGETKTYMIYHNGSLPYGCGYRRVACIAELEFQNGYINFVNEYSTGLDGVASKITQDDTPIGHLYTVNSHGDAYYPINLPTFWKAESSYENGEEDAMWEIEAAKYVPEGEDANYYVSIQAYNMAGLYLTYDLTTGKVVITQDDKRDGTAESDALQARMSFKTVMGENGGVMFQCVANSDYYLAIIDGELVVTNTATAAQCTFRVQTQIANRSETYAYNEGVTVAQN